MRLAFLIEGVYAPYAKWLGTAFAELRCASRLGPPIGRALADDEPIEREDALGEALEIAAQMHNDLEIGEPLEPTTRDFFDRPYRVISAARFEQSVRDAITDDRLRALPTAVGAADQLCDASGVLASPRLTRFLRRLYSP